MTTRTESMQQWERAEIARSSVEATLTADEALRVSEQTFARYASPPRDTAYPLEYAYHELGRVAGQRIVDFGCGSGANSVLLANRGAHVWGIDISEDLLRLAQRRLAVSGRAGGATFIAGSAHDMPFPDNSIDVVFGIAILHHLDLDLVSREVRRVLKPGGRAIFQEPVRNSPVIRFVRSLIPYRAPDISPYERPLTDGELRAIRRGIREMVGARVRAAARAGRAGVPVLKNYWRALYRVDRAAPASRAVAGALRVGQGHFADEITINSPLGGCGTPVISPPGTLSSSGRSLAMSAPAGRGCTAACGHEARVERGFEAIAGRILRRGSAAQPVSREHRPGKVHLERRVPVDALAPLMP